MGSCVPDSEKRTITSHTFGQELMKIRLRSEQARVKQMKELAQQEQLLIQHFRSDTRKRNLVT